MKLNYANTVKTNDDQFTSTNLSIGDPRVIVDILTKRLYSKPVDTSLKEYLTNALEANIENGNKQPVEIILPTQLNNYTCTIRDYGKGLSPDQMKNVFMSLGTSTKRHTDNLVGGFGIGSKSAFSFSTTFLINSYYNNQKYSYICELADGNIKLTQLDISKSFDPSGLEIKLIIPSHKTYGLQDYLKELCSGLDAHLIPLINKKAACLPLTWQKLKYNGKTYEYCLNTPQKGLYVGSSGLYFPFPSAGNRQLFAALRLPTSEVKIAPNREALIETESLNKLINGLNMKVFEIITEDIRNLLSLPDFIDKYADFREMMGSFGEHHNVITGNYNPLFTKPLTIERKRIVFPTDIYSIYHLVGSVKNPYAEFTKTKGVYLQHIYNVKPPIFFHFDSDKPSKTFAYRAGMKYQNRKIYLIPNEPIYKKFIKQYKVEPLSIFKKKPVRNTGSTGKTKDSKYRVISYFGTYVSFNNYQSLDKIKEKYNYIVYCPFREKNKIYHLPIKGDVGLAIIIPNKTEEPYIAKQFPHIDNCKWLINILSLPVKRANAEMAYRHKISNVLTNGSTYAHTLIRALCKEYYNLKFTIPTNMAIRFYERTPSITTKDWSKVHDYLREHPILNFIINNCSYSTDNVKSVINYFADEIDWDEAFQPVYEKIQWRASIK